MKKTWPIVFCVLLGACEPREAPQEEKNIVDNLPISDRDLLLEPLESALDDLREMILRDGSYFSSSYAIKADEISAEVHFKLDGADTVMVSVESHAGNLREYHEQFTDDRGNVFYSLHRFEQVAVGVDAVAPLKEYKFYYEDNGVQLSAYARMGFEEGSVGEWTPVCMTAEEERFILGRLNHIRHLDPRGS